MRSGGGRHGRCACRLIQLILELAGPSYSDNQCHAEGDRNHKDDDQPDGHESISEKPTNPSPPAKARTRSQLGVLSGTRALRGRLVASAGWANPTSPTSGEDTKRGADKQDLGAVVTADAPVARLVYTGSCHY